MNFNPLILNRFISLKLIEAVFHAHRVTTLFAQLALVGEKEILPDIFSRANPGLTRIVADLDLHTIETYLLTDSRGHRLRCRAHDRILSFIRE